MQVYEVGTKEKEKIRAADVASLIVDMEEMERWNGVTEAKIVENWYELKQQLREALIAEAPKEEKK